MSSELIMTELLEKKLSIMIAKREIFNSAFDLKISSHFA